MRSPITKYCNSIDALNQELRKIKHMRCPHCGRTGFLIGHGFLKGYTAAGHGRKRRGRRFFCSNRNRRRGCGRTFSMLLARTLRRFCVRTDMLWKFLENVFNLIYSSRLHLSVRLAYGGEEYNHG